MWFDVLNLWSDALIKATEYGLIAILFVVLLKFILTKLDKKINKIDESLAYWNTFIRANAPLGVTNEQAKKLLDVSFSRDMYEIMDYISTDLLFRAEKEDLSEEILRDRLVAKMDDVIKDTRGFLENFRTSKGPIKEPLEQKLPLSDGLMGDQEGDKVFRDIADKIVTHLRDNSMGSEDKLNKIKTEGRQRFEESQKLLVRWLEGDTA